MLCQCTWIILLSRKFNYNTRYIKCNENNVQARKLNEPVGFQSCQLPEQFRFQHIYMNYVVSSTRRKIMIIHLDDINFPIHPPGCSGAIFVTRSLAGCFLGCCGNHLWLATICCRLRILEFEASQFIDCQSNLVILCCSSIQSVVKGSGILRRI